MTRHELSTRYFEWMCDLVCDGKQYRKSSYRKLLQYLNSVTFTYILSLDGNRYEDGIDLRYRFGYDNDIDESVIASYLDDRPCSVLEMMIALSRRCEEHIMFNPDIGDRTGQWFWGMISNLGLIGMTDSRFNESYAEEIIDRFLNRKYERNGEGGLVTVSNSQYDMRTTEIWYQIMWYLTEVLNH